MTQQWTKEQAWEWYNNQPWIRGFNGYPANCRGRVDMWQEYNHRAVFDQIEREFALARSIGYNAVRAIIQFEVWFYEHDSFMANLEEYFTLADKYGIKVMLTLGNDCTQPKALYEPVKFGPQKVDWGYHSGIARGPHAFGHTEPGYMLLDEAEYEPHYYRMVDEIAAKYAKDPRLQIWDVWNEPGHSRRGTLSLRHMEKFFEIIRSHDPIQPLTADAHNFNTPDFSPIEYVQQRALELSDIITFHCYNPLPKQVLLIDKLKELGRPMINNEWLHRIKGCNVQDMFPLFYLERVGCYNWGLIAGASQTYEPWGMYFNEEIMARKKAEGEKLDLSKWQHDLFRMNGHPYDEEEIEIIKRFTKAADQRFAREHTK